MNYIAKYTKLKQLQEEVCPTCLWIEKKNHCFLTLFGPSATLNEMKRTDFKKYDNVVKGLKCEDYLKRGE